MKGSTLLMTTKILSIFWIMMLILVSPTVNAKEGLEPSVNVALSSEYIFRGQTQTLGDPTISGGFDLGWEGAFIGMWASEVDYGDGLADLEVDLYAGYGYEWNDLSVGYTYVDYNYNGDSSLDGVEHQISLGYKDLGLLHVVGAEGFVDYSEISYTVPLIEIDVSWGTWDTIGDNWSIGKSFDMPGELEGTLQYIEFHGDAGISNERNLVFSISKTVGW